MCAAGGGTDHRQARDILEYRPIAGSVEYGYCGEARVFLREQYAED